MTATTNDIAATNSASKMEASLHSGDLTLIEKWADEWRALCDESAADQPFFRPEWTLAHLRAFSPQAKVALVTVHCDGKLSFLLPLVRERAFINGVPVRRLRAPVNQHTLRFDAVRRAGPEGEAATAAAWAHLQTLSGWDVIEFRSVPVQGTISRLVAAARSNGFQTVHVPLLPWSIVPIPADVEGLQRLPENKRLRTQLRSIKRDIGTEIKFTLETRAALERFYALEAAGWKGSEGSAITCDPKLQQFYDEIAAVSEHNGNLAMYVLEHKGELLASHFGLIHRGRYYSPKVAYNEKFPQFAPGHLIVGEILQDCVSRGIVEYDITGTADDWKRRWTSQTEGKSAYYIFQRGLVGKFAHFAGFKVKSAIKQLIRRPKSKSESTAAKTEVNV